MNITDANRLVESLGTLLRHGGGALEDVPKVLREVLETGAWREFVTRMGQHVKHERFEDFVTTEPLAGVGGNMELVRKIASTDRVLEDLVDRATQRKPGEWSTKRATTFDNVKDSDPPTGNDRTYALRRLRKDRPDLHAQVLSGEKSANAAMMEAGFRKRTVVIPLEPEGAVRILRRHFDDAALEKMRELL